VLASIENHLVEPSEQVLLAAMRTNRARRLELQEREEKPTVEYADDDATFVAHEFEDAVLGFSEEDAAAAIYSREIVRNDGKRAIDRVDIHGSLASL
jgi:hypothetical protein